MPHIVSTANYYAYLNTNGIEANSIGGVTGWRVYADSVLIASNSKPLDFEVITSNQRFVNAGSGAENNATMTLYVDFELKYSDDTQTLINGYYAGTQFPLVVEFDLTTTYTYTGQFGVPTTVTGDLPCAFQSKNPRADLTVQITDSQSKPIYSATYDMIGDGVLLMSLYNHVWGTCGLQEASWRGRAQTAGVLDHAVINWGDGITSTVPLKDYSSEYLDLGYPPGSQGPAYAPLVTHAFSKNDGPLCSYYVVDKWGRKSNIVQFSPNPVILFDVLDNERGGLLIDARRSFSQGMAFTIQGIKSGRDGLRHLINADLDLDEGGQVFQIEPDEMQGQTIELEAKFAFQYYLTASHNYQRQTYACQRREPTYGKAEYANGLFIEAVGGIKNGDYQGQSGLSKENYLSDGSLHLAAIQNASTGRYQGVFPRVSLDDAETYVLVYSKDETGGRRGEIWLHYSADFGRSYEEVAKVWDAGVFNFDFSIMATGGGCTVAMQRVDGQVGVGQFWFKRTGDLEKWEGIEPVRIDPAAYHDELVYPRLLCEENVGRGSAIWIFLASVVYRSTDGGITWNKIT